MLNSDNGETPLAIDAVFDKWAPFFPELNKAEFVANVEQVMAARAASEQRTMEALTQYKARPLPKFTDLPFVGKKFISRNRLSADKLTSWAVNPAKKDAATGFDYAWQFMHHLSQLHTAGHGVAGRGAPLGAVIEAMADTLAACKTANQREAHLKVIRGFSAMFERAALIYFDGARSTDESKANTYTDHTQPHQLERAAVNKYDPHAWKYQYLLLTGQL